MRLALRQARAAVDTSPTPAQIEAGNYAKGHLRLHGLDISIENPRGSIRRSKPGAAHAWETRMHADYGYVRGTEGADGDHVDAFIGPDQKSQLAFVVNQNKSNGSWDEHKVMLGYPTLPAAWDGYRRNYPAGWKIGPTTTLTLLELQHWLAHGDTSEPLPEWHRPCLWAAADDGPDTFIAKADGEIKYNPRNHLGTDKLGRAHWRSPFVEPQHAFAWGKPETRPNTTTILPLSEYDHIIVSFSGGKDSVTMVLDLLERGLPPERIELWHQLIDGEPGSPALMDWPVTYAYVDAFAKALNLRVRYQWKHGGFEGEMMRQNQPTAPTSFELGGGQVGTAGGKTGKSNTRLKFPQASADLKVRWCSAYLKIDVAARAITNDPRFNQQPTKVLMLTGERRQESSARSKYAEAEKHGTSTLKRRVDHWRPILDWPETAVWDIMRRWGVRPHPAYELGWNRVSCMSCIFGDKHQWAAAQGLAPSRFAKIADLEKRFGLTIKRSESVLQQAAKGIDFTKGASPELIKLALGHEYRAEDILVRDWKMPAGAFRRQGGPS